MWPIVGFFEEREKKKNIYIYIYTHTHTQYYIHMLLQKEFNLV